MLCRQAVAVVIGRAFGARAAGLKSLNTAHQSKPAVKVEKEDAAAALQPQAAQKPKHESFIKNLFMGRFDTSVLAFPEVLDRDRHEMLHDMVVPIERFFEEQVDGSKIDKDAKIPTATLEGVKELGLYGQQIPEEYGGLGLGATEYARIAEITSLDASISVTLAAHQAIGLKGILIAGTEAQKAQYLPRLATGEWTAAFCLTEAGSGSDAASIQSRATLSPDGSTWTINGSKMWISNGGYADLMTVFAKTAEEQPNGEIKDQITAFIVERNFGGVSSGPPEDKLGIRGSNTCEVFFDNVPVPAENVLGTVGGGFKMAMNILNSGRFSMGSSVAGTLKKLMKMAADYAVTRHQFSRPLSDFALIKEKFARMTISIYAMESMAYLTAGILDGTQDPDCSVESAIVKVFSSEASWRWGSECLQVLGGLGYMQSYPFERFLRDFRILLIFEGTNEILRLFIALSGLQQAGMELQDLVKKLRNPLMHPGFILGKGLEQFRHQNDSPKLDLGLAGYLHPSLQSGAEALEYCVKRFQYAVETLLTRYGAEVVDPKNQLEVARLADCAIDLYAMTAVLARASRSHCIGIHNSDHEIMLALMFCEEACKRVKTAVKDLEGGPIICGDHSINIIADKVLSNGGYVADHPLTRTYW